VWRWPIKLTLTGLLKRWYSTEEIQPCRESVAPDIRETEGAICGGKEEMSCTPCPYGSGYIHVEDPL